MIRTAPHTRTQSLSFVHNRYVMLTSVPAQPAIAILHADTLAAIGLTDVIREMMPGAVVHLFRTVAELERADRGQFFHYFVSSELFLSRAHYFLTRLHKTIVLLHGNESNLLPQGLRTFNVCLPENDLVRQLLRLARSGHGAPGHEPDIVRQAVLPAGTLPATLLTTREIEVLCLLVAGLTNKEIAARLGVAVATIISHRKNIADKLGAKSLSAMTIFAVAHGLVKAEDI